MEQVIFRGFLFRAMEKDGLKTAVMVSAVSFGAGHIVNLANTSDTLGVLLQMGYAIAVGFLYTVIVYKGGSLWTCAASHLFVNGACVIAREQGPFSRLPERMNGNGQADAQQIASAVLIVLVCGGYALWLWKRAD